ncbi:putative glycoside hydrolase [uncultured Eubacterium sp.]|uniref:putative glycoside hydrolase n=1 Tax=uncultured Eubacterium sp. TaxID=165185 RepID=UPI0026322ED0|nr:putative glycoside hydrolase [uncultured Eubacterium sp.]
MSKKQEKRKFYTNEHRNEHWTEEPKGRPIDFADKYTVDGETGDMYNDKRRAAQHKAQRKKESRQKAIKIVVSSLAAVALLFGGYTAMDVHMIRQAEPAEKLLRQNSSDSNALSQISINVSSIMTESVSLDNSTMLTSVINDVHNFSANSITFDAKREDGTIGYRSSLATIDTYGAVSDVGSDSVGSIKQLIDNDILPVARICCYKDNVLPSQNRDFAVTKGKKLYTDSNGNNYLNPNNEQVYNYILDIVRELKGYGVQVFVLYGCDLPSDISDKYNDGFKKLAKRLQSDLGGDVKLLKEVDVKVTGRDAESGNITNSAIDKEIKNFDKLSDNQIYYISTSLDTTRVYNHVANAGVERFIIAQ